MPHVVTANCHLCRFTECVAVCPVECFHADAERVYIDPAVCIDCSACIPACPVEAIAEVVADTPEAQALIALNASAAAVHPLLVARTAALPTAEARRAELGF